MHSSDTARDSSRADLKGYWAMQLKDIRMDLVVEDARQLATRLALAKKEFAKQKISVKVEHLQELERLHSQCAEFQRCFEKLEDAQASERDFNYAQVELAWNKSMDAVDVLLHGLH